MSYAYYAQQCNVELTITPRAARRDNLKPKLPPICGPWIALIKVPAYAATLHVTARQGSDWTGNDLSTSSRDSEIQVKALYKFEKRKERDGGAMVEERCRANKTRLSVNQGSGDDASCNFRTSKCQDVQN